MSTTSHQYMEKTMCRLKGENMRILDACCGPKMMWYEKHEPHTTYLDKRKGVYKALDRGMERKIEVQPDVLGDFRDLPFESDWFDLVIFDPPHLLRAGQESWLAKKYGTLDVTTWKSDLQRGFKECMRVLKPTGTLAFKWSEDQISFAEILRTLKEVGYSPILGDKKSKTRWTFFIKRERPLSTEQEMLAGFNDAEREIYKFLISVGASVQTVTYPLMVLNEWLNGRSENLDYPNKQRLLNALEQPQNLDRPLALALKIILQERKTSMNR